MNSRIIPVKALLGAVILGLSFGTPSLASAQAVEGHWADDGDPVAAELLEMERIWATLACTPGDGMAAATKAFVEQYIADDFIGTSPSGALYGKADMLPKPGATGPTERDCKVLNGKVRFFGPDLAVIYGSESAIVTAAKGKPKPRVLIWTDTVVRRAGKWQIIAVQDMDEPAK
jgi:hypothetical protein